MQAKHVLSSHEHDTARSAAMRKQGRRRSAKKHGLAAVAAAVACLTLSVASSALASPRLAKPGSTHPSFPLDAFAKPAFNLVFADDEPVGNATAKELLRRAQGGSGHAASKSEKHQEIARLSPNGQSRLDHDEQGDTAGQWPDAPYRAYLHRSSPDTLHICTLTEPQEASNVPQNLYLDDAGVAEYRRRVLSRALELLAPLKDTCLYHTMNWFTYSLCYGDAIKQFRALSGNSMTGKAPTPDPSKPSFVLGRWRNGIDSIRGDDASRSASRAQRSHATVTDGSTEPEDSETGRSSLLARERASAASGDDTPLGTELMELVHFSSIDDIPSTHRDGSDTTSYASLEGKGRYISQTWTDGTLCDMNDEPRTAEVQFHCAESSVRDRITYVKEVTTCNYVVVVETSRLCQEPALKQKEDEVHEVRCRPILSDEALEAHRQRNISRQHSSLAIDAANASARAEAQRAASARADDGKVAEADASKAEQDAQAARSKSANEHQAGQVALQRIIDELQAKMRERHAQDINEVEIVVGWDENGQFILEPRRDGAALDPYEVFGSAGVASAVEQAEAHARGMEGDLQGADPHEYIVREAEAEQTAAALKKVQQLVDKLAAMQPEEAAAELQGAEVFFDAQDGATPTDNQEQHAPAQPAARQPQQNGGHGNPQARGAGQHAPVAQQAPHPRARALAREPETLGARVERFYKLLEVQQAQKQRQASGKAEKDANGDDSSGNKQAGKPPRRKDEL